MKKLIIVLTLMANLMILMGQQEPFGISYQAVARNEKGNELINKRLDVRFSILKGNVNGELVWQELHQVETNEYGLFTLIIGNGTKQSGTAPSFIDIPWNAGTHYLRVEVDFGNNFVDMGTSQMLAVPYALYALHSGNSGVGSQHITLNPTDKTLDLSNNGGSVKVSEITSMMQVDKDSTNEIQTLSLEGNILKIKHGNTIDGSVTINTTDNDRQALSLKGHVLSIENGNSITLPDSVNEAQNLSLTTLANNRTLTISKGNTVSFNVDDADADPTNEIQDLYESRDTIYISKKALPTKIDLVQKLTVDKANNKLTIKRGNTIEIDADPTNEIQDLNLTANMLKITKNSLATGIDLTKYTDDKQNLTLNESAKTIAIDRGNSIDVTNLVNTPWEGFSYNNNSGVSIQGGQEFLIPWNKEFDDGNLIQNNALVSASNNAVYSLTVNIALSSSTTTNLNIYKGTTLFRSFTLYEKSFITSFLIKLNQGESISIKIQNGDTYATNLRYSYFSGYRVH